MPARVLKFPPRGTPQAGVPERSREEFLAEPWRILRTSPSDIPPVWVGEAWSQRGFRKRVTDALVRSLEQNGDLYTSAGLLESLGQAGLRKEAVIELYVAIRDRVEAAESEWRTDFEVAFDQHTEFLPPPSDG